MKHSLLASVSGLLFGVGLLVAGMTRPSKVVGFLDVTGDWDPSLGFVMMGAIAVHFVAYRLVPRLPSPWLGGTFSIPTRADVDGRLIAGAALFGLGWGLGGFCPGPAIVTLATGGTDVLVFVGGMLGGMALFQLLDRTLLSRAA